ncbi:protein of unknown function [Citrobacter amalonaticus]|nr:protein of unknown function [Citrobacter amalonaticus]
MCSSFFIFTNLRTHATMIAENGYHGKNMVAKMTQNSIHLKIIS